MKTILPLFFAIVLLVYGIVLLTRYVELGQVVFDGTGIGIYGWEVLNEELPFYRNCILAASLVLFAVAAYLVYLFFRETVKARRK